MYVLDRMLWVAAALAAGIIGGWGIAGYDQMRSVAATDSPVKAPAIASLPQTDKPLAEPALPTEAPAPARILVQNIGTWSKLRLTSQQRDVFFTALHRLPASSQPMLIELSGRLSVDTDTRVCKGAKNSCAELSFVTIMPKVVIPAPETSEPVTGTADPAPAATPEPATTPAPATVPSADPARPTASVKPIQTQRVKAFALHLRPEALDGSEEGIFLILHEVAHAIDYAGIPATAQPQWQKLLHTGAATTAETFADSLALWATGRDVAPTIYQTRRSFTDTEFEQLLISTWQPVAAHLS